MRPREEHEWTSRYSYDGKLGIFLTHTCTVQCCSYQLPKRPRSQTPTPSPPARYISLGYCCTWVCALQTISYCRILLDFVNSHSRAFRLKKTPHKKVSFRRSGTHLSLGRACLLVVDHSGVPSGKNISNGIERAWDTAPHEYIPIPRCCRARLSRGWYDRSWGLVCWLCRRDQARTDC